MQTVIQEILLPDGQWVLVETLGIYRSKKAAKMARKAIASVREWLEVECKRLEIPCEMALQTMTAGQRLKLLMQTMNRLDKHPAKVPRNQINPRRQGLASGQTEWPFSKEI